jgi:tetratricopeptide (TPR) repeat protein
MTADAAPTAPALAAAQADYDAGRLQAALAAARAFDHDAVAPADRTEAVRLRAQAAFRLGELDEAADAAQALLDRLGGQAPSYPGRIRVLAVSVVAAGELGRFEQALGHLQQMLSAASKGSLDDYVRARGTAATCFALLGDPWAGQRLLSELLGLFQGLPSEALLEAVARNNHAGVCLLVARLARAAGDADECLAALDHAEASLERSRELARLTGDARLGAFVDVHASEAMLLRGDAAEAMAPLQAACDHAAAAGLPAHTRQLRVLLAEACIGAGEPERALRLLHDADGSLREGHELGLRIRCMQQLQHALEATGALAAALEQAARARALDQYRLHLQLRTQSRFLRMRLELEHLYRYRSSASRGVSSQPGALTLPASLDASLPPRR